MTVEIQHGCTKHPTKPNTWIYSEADIMATLDFQETLKVVSVDKVHVFISEPGQKPEIGDSIIGGYLVKRTTPKVNNDWSKWKDKDL